MVSYRHVYNPIVSVEGSRVEGDPLPHSALYSKDSKHGMSTKGVWKTCSWGSCGDKKEDGGIVSKSFFVTVSSFKVDHKISTHDFSPYKGKS